MSSVIIFQKDLEDFGKNLMKKVYDQLHDDYMLKEFNEIKIAKDYWDKNLVTKFKNFIKKINFILIVYILTKYHMKI